MSRRVHRARTAPTVLLAALVGLAGCAQPLPPTQLAYVGVWRGEGVLLRITRAGHLDYRRRSDATEVELSLPIRQIADGVIVAGLPLWNTEFRVDRPPVRRDGRWTMVIDGRALVRLDEGGGERGVEI